MKTFQEFLAESTALHYADHMAYHRDMEAYHDDKAFVHPSGPKHDAHKKAAKAHVDAMDSHDLMAKEKQKYTATEESRHAKSMSEKADKA